MLTKRDDSEGDALSLNKHAGEPRHFNGVLNQLFATKKKDDRPPPNDLEGYPSVMSAAAEERLSQSTGTAGTAPILRPGMASGQSSQLKDFKIRQLVRDEERKSSSSSSSSSSGSTAGQQRGGKEGDGRVPLSKMGSNVESGERRQHGGGIEIEELQDEEGRTYYYNRLSGVTAWTREEMKEGGKSTTI